MNKRLIGSMVFLALVMAGCDCDRDEDGILKSEAEAQMAADAEREREMYGTAEGTEEETTGTGALSDCDEFPEAEYVGFPATDYAVCAHASNGTCYYKMSLPRPIPGCDLAFGTYPQGNPACFVYVSEVFDAQGAKIATSAEDYRTADVCATTTVEHFNSKVDHRSSVR